MVDVETIASIFVKLFKFVLNIIVIVLYRTGDGGNFLGVAGVLNLNEEKNADAEIVASGVFVGYLIYTSVQLISFAFGTTKHKRELTDTLMNFVGTFLWLAVGGVALHYWSAYLADHDFIYVATERQVGLALGSICILSAALFLLDTVLAFVHFAKDEPIEYKPYRGYKGVNN